MPHMGVDWATDSDEDQHPPAAFHSRAPRFTVFLRGLIVALVIVGLVLRLRQFNFERSLWLDEAMLALSIVSRPAIELLQPLEFNQNAPPLFLLASKAATVLFGINEKALRAVPQIAGWFVVVGFAVALWRSLTAPVAAVGASLAALSPALIRFANEAKPYGVDAAATVFFLLMTLDHTQRFTQLRWWVLRIAGCFAIWFSHPAVFVATAMWMGLLFRFRSAKNQRAQALSTGAFWLASFVVSYALFGHRDAGNERVRAGYSTAFLPPSADSTERLPLMIAGTFLPAFQGDGANAPAISGTSAMFLVFVMVMGAAAGARLLGAWVVCPLLGPLVLAYGAAAFGFYPVGVPRLMMFGYPCVLLAATCLGAFVLRRLEPRAELLALILWFLILWPSYAQAAKSWIAPFRGDDFRGAYAEYSSLQLGEPVYISAKAQPAWLFYSTNWYPSTRRQSELMAQRLRFYFEAGGQGPSFENAASRGRPVQPGEGSELVFDFRGRSEVLGIATGRQWRWPSYVSPVDEGWASSEAQRVRTAGRLAGRPCEWIIFERLSELSYRPLRDALRFENDGRRERQLSYPGVTMAQICH